MEIQRRLEQAGQKMRTAGAGAGKARHLALCRLQPVGGVLDRLRVGHHQTRKLAKNSEGGLGIRPVGCSRKDELDGLKVPLFLRQGL